jgi:hypothetical protein
MVAMQACVGRIRQIRRFIRVLRSPKISIEAFGGDDSWELFKKFNSRHPKVPIFRFKTFGVAIRDLRVAPDALFAGGDFKEMRRKVRIAEKKGYRGKIIDPAAHFKEIMDVNRSSPERQGMKMPSGYTEEEEVRSYNSRSGIWFGIFDSEGILRAYCHMLMGGNYYIYSRLLGDGRRLNDGIMFLLMRDTMQLMHQRLLRTGHPRWAMYDMYLGALEGLREFKRHTGFSPTRVSWRWTDHKEEAS